MGIRKPMGDDVSRSKTKIMESNAFKKYCYTLYWHNGFLIYQFKPPLPLRFLGFLCLYAEKVRRRKRVSFKTTGFPFTPFSIYMCVIVLHIPNTAQYHVCVINDIKTTFSSALLAKRNQGLELEKLGAARHYE